MPGDEFRTILETDVREPNLHEPDRQPYRILQQTDGHSNYFVQTSDGQ